MSDPRSAGSGPQDEAAVSEMRRQVSAHESREYQLWSILHVAFVALCAGFVALFLPRVVWELRRIELPGSYLPQLVIGFVSLVVLFNIYLFGQRRILRRTRDAWLAQYLRAEEALAQSLIDPLTRLFNRRYMDDLLHREVKRAQRIEGGFTVLILDVNDFKSVNNRFGHLEGDRFLQQVANLLRRTFRQSDSVIRYGGDEFLVLLPETSEDGARLAAERLERNVAAWNAEKADRPYAMKLSWGLASYDSGEEIGRVLELADRRMYANKSCPRWEDELVESGS